MGPRWDQKCSSDGAPHALGAAVQRLNVPRVGRLNAVAGVLAEIGWIDARARQDRLPADPGRDAGSTPLAAVDRNVTVRLGSSAIAQLRPRQTASAGPVPGLGCERPCPGVAPVPAGGDPPV